MPPPFGGKIKPLTAFPDRLYTTHAHAFSAAQFGGAEPDVL
jgi:hypothetical protein